MATQTLAHRRPTLARSGRGRRSLAMVVAAGVVARGLVAGVGSTPAHATTSNASYFVNAINAQAGRPRQAPAAVSAEMTRPPRSAGRACDGPVEHSWPTTPGWPRR